MLLFILAEVDKTDMTVWSPASIAHLLGNVTALVIALVSLISVSKAREEARAARQEALAAKQEAQGAMKEADSNKAIMVNHSREQKEDIRSLNEQMTMVAKDMMPAGAAKELAEVVTTLKECADTIRGQ